MNELLNIGDTVECGDRFRVVEGEIVYEKFIIVGITLGWVHVVDESGSPWAFDEADLMVVGS